MSNLIVILTVIANVNDLNSGVTKILGTVKGKKNVEKFIAMGSDKEIHKCNREELAELVGATWMLRMLTTPKTEEFYYALDEESENSIAIFTTVGFEAAFSAKEAGIKVAFAEENMVGDYRKFNVDDDDDDVDDDDFEDEDCEDDDFEDDGDDVDDDFDPYDEGCQECECFAECAERHGFKVVVEEE